MAPQAPDIHVIITALRMEMRGFSPAAKFLLVRGIGLLEGGVSEDTQRELAAELGMSIRALASAQRDLVDAGYASWKRSGSKSRQHIGITTQGHFRHGFSLDTERVREIRVEATHLQMYVPTYPKEMLKRLILAKSYSAPQLPEGMALRYSNRLLLATLLAHSDDFGVVWNCSRGRLAELTGLGKGQVNSQLKKLEAAGFVRHRIPGINGRDLFSKSPGAILLNISETAPLQPGPECPPVAYLRLSQSELQALKAFRSLFKQRRLTPETGRDYLPPEANAVVDDLVNAEYGVGGKSWPEEWEAEVTRAIFRVSRWLGSARQQGFFAHGVYKLSEYASLFLREPGKLGRKDVLRVVTLGVENEPDISGAHQDACIEQCVLRGIFRFYGHALAREFTGYTQRKFSPEYAYLSFIREWEIVPGPFGSAKLYFLGLPGAGRKISQI